MFSCGWNVKHTKYKIATLSEFFIFYQAHDCFDKDTVIL